MTSGQELLCKVFCAKAKDVAGKSDEYCSELLNGALRFKMGTLKLDGLEATVEDWLFGYWETLEPLSADWLTEPSVGTLVNGYDGPRELWQYSLPDVRFMKPPLRQDTHLIEMARRGTPEDLGEQFEVAATQRWQEIVSQQALENTPEEVTPMYAGSKEFVEVEKHQAVGSSHIVVPVTIVKPDAPSRRRQQATDDMVIAAIAAAKRAIACLTKKVAPVQAAVVQAPEAKAPTGDPKRYAVTIAELLPSLVHRTSDGRWYLKEHKVAFLKTETTKAWACKGINAKAWAKYEGLVMLVPVVTIVD